MPEISASPEPDQSAKTSADHIRELLQIDQDVTKILKTASLAVRDLTHVTNRSSEKNDSPDVSVPAVPRTMEDSKQAFEEHTTTYFTLIQSLSERLHRQVNALEKAGIIAPESQTADAQSQPSHQPLATRSGQAPAKVEPPMQITNGGLGNLDVGWLNSRRDAVGKQKEAELWAEARRHLESVEERRGAGKVQKEMDVD